MPDLELERMHGLVRQYRAVEAALKAAKDALNAHIINRTAPRPEDIQAEIDARARFVEVRQKLYKS